MKNFRNLPLYGLAIWHVAALLAMGWWAEDGQPTPALGLYVGLVFCQTSLLGFWGGLGTSHWLLRAAGVALGIALLTPVFDGGLRSSNWPRLPNIEIILLVSLCTLGTAGVMSIVRRVAVLRRTESVAGGHAGPVYREGLQFSIRHLIALTFVVACVVTLGKWLAPHIHGIDSGAFLLALGVCFVAVGVAAPWAMLSTTRPLLRSAVVLGMAAASSAVPIWLRGDWYAWFWVEIMLIEAALLLASLGVVRWCGFRLARVQQRPVEVKELSATTVVKG